MKLILYGEIKKARGEYSVEYSLIMIKPGFATNEIITQGINQAKYLSVR